MLVLLSVLAIGVATLSSAFGEGAVDTDRELADELYGDVYGPCPDGHAGPVLQWEDTVEHYQEVAERAQLSDITEPIDQIDLVDVITADGTGVVCAPGTRGLVWTGASYRVADGGTEEGK